MCLDVGIHATQRDSTREAVSHEKPIEWIASPVERQSMSNDVEKGGVVDHKTLVP